MRKRENARHKPGWRQPLARALAARPQAWGDELPTPPCLPLLQAPSPSSRSRSTSLAPCGSRWASLSVLRLTTCPAAAAASGWLHRFCLHRARPAATSHSFPCPLVAACPRALTSPSGVRAASPQAPPLAGLLCRDAGGVAGGGGGRGPLPGGRLVVWIRSLPVDSAFPAGPVPAPFPSPPPDPSPSLAGSAPRRTAPPCACPRPIQASPNKARLACPRWQAHHAFKRTASVH